MTDTAKVTDMIVASTRRESKMKPRFRAVSVGVIGGNEERERLVGDFRYLLRKTRA